MSELTVTDYSRLIGLDGTVWKWPTNRRDAAVVSPQSTGNQSLIVFAVGVAVGVVELTVVRRGVGVVEVRATREGIARRVRKLAAELD